MHRLILILALMVLAGCVSRRPDPALQTYWEIHRAAEDYHQQELHTIYRQGFTRGFLEAWNGRSSEPAQIENAANAYPGIVDGNTAYKFGYFDGVKAGREAREKQPQKDGH